jgi:hypothetical protein
VLKALIAAAAGAVVAVGMVAVGVPAMTGPATIRITATDTGYRRIGGAADHVGQTEIVQQRLFNPRIARPIGRGNLLCTFVNRSLRQCSGTYTLPRGRVIVAGAIESRLLFELAIVGGTGLYGNARGTVTVTSTGLRPRREVLVFRLPG